MRFNELFGILSLVFAQHLVDRFANYDPRFAVMQKRIKLISEEGLDSNTFCVILSQRTSSARIAPRTMNA